MYLVQQSSFSSELFTFLDSNRPATFFPLHGSTDFLLTAVADYFSCLISLLSTINLCNHLFSVHSSLKALSISVLFSGIKYHYSSSVFFSMLHFFCCLGNYFLTRFFFQCLEYANNNDYTFMILKSCETIIDWPLAFYWTHCSVLTYHCFTPSNKLRWSKISFAINLKAH